MVLPENVPQGDVDCAQRRHDCRPADMGPAIHVLPVVLDEARVLADQILGDGRNRAGRSEEHTSELQSLLRISYAVFCWTEKNINSIEKTNTTNVNNK